MSETQEFDLQQKVMEVIVERLATGERLPPEKKLAADLGVSRSALREVLRAFQASGLVVALQGSGWYAQPPDVSASIADGWNILLRTQPNVLPQLMDIRYVLEVGFLERAIETLGISDLQKMRDLTDRMVAKARRGEEFVEEDREFHRILFSRTGNILLEQLLKAFWDLFNQIEDLSFRRSSDLVRSAELHQQLFQAILTKDRESATRYLREQFTDIRRRLDGSQTL
ncbi:MAG: FadR family transcriptional regulator [Thermoflavifilum sp.]|nr:FadR family transcriptional regulator [Thermoflavifilum sp.]MCL6514583.1 FCD domain-containing protein [Alicyclobacillus sp.]